MSFGLCFKKKILHILIIDSGMSHFSEFEAKQQKTQKHCCLRHVGNSLADEVMIPPYFRKQTWGWETTFFSSDEMFEDGGWQIGPF